MECAPRAIPKCDGQFRFKSIGLFCMCLSAVLTGLPDVAAADVDVIAKSVSALDPTTGFPTNLIRVRPNHTVTIDWRVVVESQAFGGETTVTKKIEVNKRIPVALQGAVMKCTLGAGFAAGQLEKQDGTKANAHDVDIIGGQLPALACSVGTVVAGPNPGACPGAPVDQAAGVHPYEFQVVIGGDRICKHFVGQDTTLEAKAASCEVQETLLAAPNPRIYNQAYVCLWDKIKKFVNPTNQGDQNDDLPGDELDVSGLAPGTYTIDLIADITVEGAVDINPGNNSVTGSFDLVITQPVPTLSTWGLILFGLLLISTIGWFIHRQHNASEGSMAQS